MRFSQNFLREFVEINIPPAELARRLTLAGIEVVSLKPWGGDWIFEAEVTANRPDLLSIWGLSYEVRAILGGKIKFNTYPPLSSQGSLPIYIEEKKLVPFYAGRLMEGVKVERSPLWLRQRLASVGIEEINNIVDITNYCLFKWGAPLHAFDAAKIKGAVHVRRAKEGEKLLCLDGKERTLSSADLVIADEGRVLAIAGIIGGKDSEINPQTKKVFLEAAVFDPLSIRRTSRRLGLNTEASYRFERQVLPFNTAQASQEAVELILRQGGGRLVGTRKLGREEGEKGKKVTLSLARLNRYLDTRLKLPQVATILKRLGCEVRLQKEDNLLVNLPRHRKDLTAEVDLFEEAARIYGYKNIPIRLSFVNNSARVSAALEFKRRLKRISVQAGFREIVSFSLIPEEEAKKLSGYAYVKLINPLRSGENVLRPQLWGGILQAFRYNLNQSQSDLDFFEIANVYLCEGKRVQEETHYVVASVGEGEKDLLRFKGRVLTILSALGIERVEFLPQSESKFLSAALVKSQELSLGIMGVIKVGAKKNKKAKGFIFEASLGVLYKAARPPQFRPFSYLPGIKRDISLALKPGYHFSQIEPKLREVGGEMLTKIVVIDFYKGSNLPPGYRGVTLRFYYQLPQRTLTAAEVDTLHQRIRQILAESSDIILR